jgi:hypothetical protein
VGAVRAPRAWRVRRLRQRPERREDRHFVLDAVREGQMQRSVALSNGATQYNLDLPNGPYVLHLRFVDAKSKTDLLSASETPISVDGQDRL